MSENTRQNEVIVTIHGQEVLKLSPKGDVDFQGGFVLNDIEANKRFLSFFQDNLTRIIEGNEAAEKEANSAPDECGTCSGC